MALPFTFMRHGSTRGVFDAHPGAYWNFDIQLFVDEVDDPQQAGDNVYNVPSPSIPYLATEEAFWKSLTRNPQQPIRVRVAADFNTDVLNGGLIVGMTIDGVVVEPGDLILLAGETDKKNNGLWCAPKGDSSAVPNTWYAFRPNDIAGSYVDYAYGLNCVVFEGVKHHETSWTCWWGDEGDRGYGAISTKNINVRQTYSRLAFLSNRMISTPDYTLVRTDDGSFIVYTYATPTTLIIPANTFDRTSYINLIQGGAGEITLTADVGVTLHGRIGLTTAGQWAMATLFQRSPNVWVVGGDLVP